MQKRRLEKKASARPWRTFEAMKWASDFTLRR